MGRGKHSTVFILQLYFVQIIATSHISCNESVRHFMAMAKRRVCGCKEKEEEEME